MLVPIDPFNQVEKDFVLELGGLELVGVTPEEVRQLQGVSGPQPRLVAKNGKMEAHASDAIE